MRAIRVFFAAALFATVTFATPTGATSANTDLSDIWFNPNEGGWGMQMVNTGTFVFATIYVYGPNGSPTWYTGQLNNTGQAQVIYTGPLYATNGPYFGGFFNPNAVGIRQVGTMTFVGNTISTGQLTYSVDGVIVSKAVQRQLLTLDNYSGNYESIVTYTDSGCLNPANNGSGTGQLNVRITQNGTSMAVAITGPPGTIACTLVGTYSQLGRMGQVSGNTSCTDGSVGTATLFEMTNTIKTFTARFSSYDPADGCTEAADIVGVIPR